MGHTKPHQRISKTGKISRLAGLFDGLNLSIREQQEYRQRAVASMKKFPLQS